MRSPLNSLLADIGVTFSVSEGDGTVPTEQPVSTDTNGVACTQFRLGMTPGKNGVAATARDVNSPLAAFEAQGTGPGGSGSLFELITQRSSTRLVGGGAGDVNGDGRVNIADAAVIEAVLSEAAVPDSSLAPHFTANADANSDGARDIGDEMVILHSTISRGRSRDRLIREAGRPIRAYLRPPRGAPAPAETFRVPVYVKDLGEDVVAYALQVLYDRCVLEVVAIDGGTFPGFTERPITNPATFKRGRTRFAAVNRGLLRTHRTINVANIVFRVVGDSETRTEVGLAGAGRAPVAVRRGFETRSVRARRPLSIGIAQVLGGAGEAR